MTRPARPVRSYRRLDRSLVRAVVHARREALRPFPVLEAVVRHTGYRIDQLVGPGRGRGVTYARHLAMYALKEHSRIGVNQIAVMFGGRDHSTVCDGIKRIELEMTWREATRVDVATVAQILKVAA